MRIIKFLLVLVLILVLVSCGEGGGYDTHHKIHIVNNAINLAKNFLDASIVLFNAGNNRQGLARLYYMYYSMHSINIFSKTNETKVKGEKKHENAWKGSLANKKLSKTFGKEGFLTIRHKCDYTYISEKELNEFMEFWLEKTSIGYKSLLEEMDKSLLKNLKCEDKDCKNKLDCTKTIEDTKNKYDDLKKAYESLVSEQKLSIKKNKH